MINKEKTLKAITRCGIIAVIRGKEKDKVLKAIQAVSQGGINVIEVTFTIPGAAKIIKELAATMSDKIILGAGTVINPEMAKEAVEAGSTFLVSPNINLEVIEMGKEAGFVLIPGALSPTEIVTAWQAGADMVKIFPANLFGPRYLKDIKGPLPRVPLVPTGGVNLNTARDFLKAGAACLGVGGALIDKEAIKEGRFEVLTEKAKKFREITEGVKREISP
ncbi:bifunctional 4-hydroxy-2-oxoglutarate aldolase/2-dehydro-3-deoxy-phosphogluconate aldolase [candidate division NPL-UPA2 bacterium]|nr:bifunctional 4-hydroxy-2-oxoglutarate aldolase/2-dehydro-3-deoxy-phosphogluconate aldolase [candidate division NPL-UPA2 bacterium]